MSTNNYIRDQNGNFHFFDDRKPEEVKGANSQCRAMPRGGRTVAWRQAPGLVVDGYVGIPSRDED
jgi:hypothetical protein